MAVPDQPLLLSVAEAAFELASEAGARLRDYLRGPLEVHYKGPGRQNPVTAADRAMEAFLRDGILSRFPNHGVLGEEGALAPGGEAGFLWVLDPLDGTTNFLHRLPLFAISIGVLQRGVPVAAAIYTPAGPGGEAGVFHARRGAGAFFQGQILSIPPQGSPSPGRLVSLPARFDRQMRFAQPFLERAQPLERSVSDSRTLGSIALELSYAAAGLLQYIVSGPPRIWDVAGGLLLVQEAGGIVLARGRRGPWRPLELFDPPPGEGTEAERLRRWSGGTLIAGSPELAWLVARSLHRRWQFGSRLRALWGGRRLPRDDGAH